MSLRFVRYATVGAVATLVHWCLLAWLVEHLGWRAWAASGTAAVAGAQVAFAGNQAFTFAGANALPWPGRWLRFQLTAAAGAAAGMVIVAGGVRVGLHYLAAQALATAAVLLATFVVNARWTFARRDLPC